MDISSLNRIVDCRAQFAERNAQRRIGGRFFTIQEEIPMRLSQGILEATRYPIVLHQFHLQGNKLHLPVPLALTPLFSVQMESWKFWVRAFCTRFGFCTLITHRSNFSCQPSQAHLCAQPFVKLHFPEFSNAFAISPASS